MWKTYRTLHENSKTSNYDSNLNSSSPKTSTSGDKLHLERVAWGDEGDLPSPPSLHVLKWRPSPHIYRGEPPSPQPGFEHGTPWTDIVSQLRSDTSKPEGSGAHGLVGHFLRLGCSLGPLVNVCLDSVYIGFLLWWAFRSMWISCDGVWSDVVLLLSWKGYDCPSFLANTCTHRNLEGHVEFGDLLVAWVWEMQVHPFIVAILTLRIGR